MSKATSAHITRRAVGAGAPAAATDAAQGARVRDAISDLEAINLRLRVLRDALKEVAASTTVSRDTLSYLAFEPAERVTDQSARVGVRHKDGHHGRL
jgi:hypothetical protein